MSNEILPPSDDERSDDSFNIKKLKVNRLYVFLALSILVFIVSGFHYGRPAFSRWRLARDLGKLQQYEKQEDFRSALLLGEQLSRQHPADAEARRTLAGIYERTGQGEAMKVWEEAVALEPANPAGNAGLARTAIRFGNRPLAHAALDRLAGQGGNPADLYRLRAGLALLEQDRAAQEKNLAALVQLTPGDDRAQLNLAAVRLRDPASPEATTARTTLRQLAKKDPQRIRAVVELLNDVARRWPTPTRERSEALRELADALTPPRGPLVEAPSQVNHTARLVNFAMTQPAPEPEDVFTLANWMSLNGETRTALQWIDGLPASVQENQLLETAHAEFALKERDWPRLRRLLLEGAWGPVPAVAVQQVFRAHDLAQRAASDALPGWSAALEACRTSPPGLRMLLRLTRVWEWRTESRQVLLAIARASPRENGAWRELISEALQQEDSQQLYQVYTEWRRALPSDPVMLVESAILAELLDWKKNPTPADTAEYIRQQPGNAGAVVAHALSLWRDGRKAEAAADLDALPAPAFQEPRYALAYGVILADVGRAEKSQQLLNSISLKVLLPEERDLVLHARASNRHGP